MLGIIKIYIKYFIYLQYYLSIYCICKSKVLEIYLTLQNISFLLGSKVKKNVRSFIHFTVDGLRDKLFLSLSENRGNLPNGLED
jgi:hypothetical protein